MSLTSRSTVTVSLVMEELSLRAGARNVAANPTRAITTPNTPHSVIGYTPTILICTRSMGLPGTPAYCRVGVGVGLSQLRIQDQ